MTKDFLQGYRTLIFFVILTSFQIIFMAIDIQLGKETLTTWVAGSAIWLGTNKVSTLISKEVK